MVSHVAQAIRLDAHSCRFEQRPDIGTPTAADFGDWDGPRQEHATDYLLGMRQSALEP